MHWSKSEPILMNEYHVLLLESIFPNCLCLKHTYYCAEKEPMLLSTTASLPSALAGPLSPDPSALGP